MVFEIKRKVIRVSALAGISALAMVLVAAGVDLERDWARLRQLPREQRLKLIDNLRRFDLVFAPAQQQSLRDLDRRIAELPPERRAQYLAALRRYYNWLNHLPENRRAEVLDEAPNQRIPKVRKLIASTNPLPHIDTGKFLQFADIGEFSPFELAAVFKIWEVLTPGEKQAVEKKVGDPQRLQEVFRLGRTKSLDQEVKPEAFDDAEWLTKTETYLRKNRPILAAVLDDPKVKENPRRAQILRRQAINFYFFDKFDKKEERVNPDRLAAFVTAFPPFIQDSFEQYPPDEARRRLTIVYRLVFPPGKEMKPAASAPPPAARPAPGTPRQDSNSAGTSQKKPGGSPF